MILGLQSPAAGAVEALGPVDTTGDGRRRRGLGRQERRGQVGYVPQKFLLDPDMPVRGRDLVALGIDGHRLGVPLPSRRRRALVEQMLEAVDAAGFADARVGELSGGEQQRILIAHALVCGRGCCCSTSHSRTSICAAPGRSSRCWPGSRRDQHLAVLISAHDMNPLLSVMDRVVYLADGRAASGTTDEVVRSDVLSRLYRHHVDVLRVHGRVIVVAGEGEPEEDARAERAHLEQAEPVEFV